MLERLLPAACLVLLLATIPASAAPAEVWLTAEDDVKVRGDLYAREGDEPKAGPIVLLFHQAGSNRGEYATIAPRHILRQPVDSCWTLELDRGPHGHGEGELDADKLVGVGSGRVTGDRE